MGPKYVNTGALAAVEKSGKIVYIRGFQNAAVDVCTLFLKCLLLCASKTLMISSLLPSLFSFTGKKVVALLFCLISCIFGLTQTPTCRQTSFIRSYSNADSAATIIDMAAVGTNGMILVGEYYSSTTSGYEGFVFRIDREGNKLWELQLAGPQSQVCRNIIQLSDNNYLIGGYDFTQTASYFVAKLDSNGTMIWRKNLNNVAFSKLAEASDGSIVVASLARISSGMHVSRLTASGDPMYSFDYRIPGELYSNELRDITVKEGFVYLVGTRFYSPGGSGMFHGFLSKVEVATGNMNWTKLYKYNAGPEQFLQVFDYGDNKLCILGQNDINSSNLNNVIICDTAGTIQSTRFFQYGLYRQFGSAVLDNNKNLIYTNRSFGVGTNNLTICSINPLTGINWSKSYPQVVSPLVTKTKINAVNEFFVAGKISPGRSHLFIGRFSSQGDMGCNPQPLAVDFGIGSLNPSNIYLSKFVITSSSQSGPVVPFANAIASGATECSLTNTCSTISLIGGDTICKRGDTLLLRIIKNTACSSVPQLSFDTSRFTLISYFSDTALLKVNQAGSSVITAQIITNCDTLTDSKEVNAIFSPDSIALGENTTLCPSNSKLLNAGSGFKNYLWQDGASNSTYLVTIPGTYYVEAYNYCGEVFRDTIIIKGAPPIAFDLGPDRSTCKGDTITITAPTGFLNYTWSPAYNINSTSGSVVGVYPSVDTIYKVVAEKTPGCFSYDSIRITVYHSPSINLGADKSICQGDSVVLNAGPSFISYSWNTGAVTQNITARAVGTYRVIGTTIDGCASTDAFDVLNIHPLPKPTLDPSSELCTRSSRLLDAGIYTSYFWHDRSTLRTFTANGLGTYMVTVKDEKGCIGSDTTHITQILPQPKNFLPIDTAVCKNGTLLLRPTQKFSSYMWNTRATTPSITINVPGIYWIEVRDFKNCFGKDSILVNPKECLKGLYVPSAFTPNGDGKNDKLRAHVFGNLKQFTFTVFNSWGQILFQTSNSLIGWDGTINGKQQLTEVFVWTCHYQFADEEPKFEKGTFTLIR
ncbi:MAG: T9SS type B sorting domain-containing protein [Chitinophagaceae bacterium]